MYILKRITPYISLIVLTLFFLLTFNCFAVKYLVSSTQVVQQTGSVLVGSTNQQILRIDVVVTSAGGNKALTATDFQFTMQNTNNVDVSNAKLYYTANSSVYATTTLLGTIANPTGTITFIFNQDISAVNTFYFWLAYDIAGGATLGDLTDAFVPANGLAFTEDNVPGTTFTPSPNNPAGDRPIDGNMTYISSTATQANITNVFQGSTNNQVIGLTVVTSGNIGPIDVTLFNFNTTGTTNTGIDISNAKLWYTGASNTFSPTTQVGSTIAAPNGIFSIAGTQTLLNGNNYFWLSYDVTAGSTIGNFVDAECPSITVDASSQNPTTTAPAGNREIAGAPALYQLSLGTTCSDECWGLTEASDGSILVTGETSIGGCGFFGDSQSFFAKLNNQGDTVWTTTFGTTGSTERGRAVIETNGGGYIVVGAASNLGAGSGDAYVVKTDVNGNISWEKTYGGVDSDRFNDVKQTSDGGYIFTGYYGVGVLSDIFVVKTDASGNLTWGKRFDNGGNIDKAYSIVEISSGGYALVGQTTGTADCWIIKLDVTGNIVWEKTYGGFGVDVPKSILNTADGGFIFVGYSETWGGGGSSKDVLLIKTDGNGNEVWSKVYQYGGGTTDVANKIEATTDGGYIITGTIRNIGFGVTDVLLLKIDVNGNVTWSKLYGGPSSEGANNVIQTSDGGYLAGGTTSSWSTGGDDMYFVKTDNTGATDCNVMNVAPTTILTPTTFKSNTTATVATGSATSTPSTTAKASGSDTIIVCTNVVLPIELISFIGKNNGVVNFLEWQTASEINNDFFTVERSDDAFSWNSIGTLSGGGNSNTVLHYSLIDDDPNMGINYYRLKQTDFDGKYEYSPVIAINSEIIEMFDISALFPNPAVDFFNFTYKGNEEKELLIEIYNHIGELVMDEKVNDYHNTIRTDKLSKGIYFVKFSQEGNTKTSKLIISK